MDAITIEKIPKSWEVVALGDICDFAGGTQPPKSTFRDKPTEGYVRLLQIRDFESDNYPTYVPLSKRLRLIEQDAVSIARYGASVGRILSGKSGAINVAIMTTFPNESRVLKPYLRYMLQLDEFQVYLRTLGGRAAQAGFNRGEITKFKFPLPPITEQTRIIKALSTLEGAALVHAQITQLAGELKRALQIKLLTAQTSVLDNHV